MKIAVWYHCILSGPRIPDQRHAEAVMLEQMGALRQSKLASYADEFHVGINGGDSDGLDALNLAPETTHLHVHGKEAQSELSTLKLLYESLEPGWAVFYHHIKGVQYPGNPIWAKWRRCMENVCVWNWPSCYDELGRGLDTVGAHWMTSRKYAMIHPSQRYWGGNFWWASSDYLLTLPRPPTDSFEKRYDAETWIGTGPKHPLVFDFAPHWPMSCP